MKRFIWLGKPHVKQDQAEGWAARLPQGNLRVDRIEG